MGLADNEASYLIWMTLGSPIPYAAHVKVEEALATRGISNRIHALNGESRLLVQGCFHWLDSGLETAEAARETFDGLVRELREIGDVARIIVVARVHGIADIAATATIGQSGAGP